MQQHASEPEFDRLSWHDDTIYGLRFETGDVAKGDWRSELILDIDHIAEWVCGSDRSVRFRVAPATLIFHDVTDLRVAVDGGDSGCQVTLYHWSIDRITRIRVNDQKICLDRPYHCWRIALNSPPHGVITFGASGFTQTLRALPVLLDEQRLPADDRA